MENKFAAHCAVLSGQWMQDLCEAPVSGVGWAGAVREMQPTQKHSEDQHVWEGKVKSSQMGLQGGRGSEHARLESHNAEDNEQYHKCNEKLSKALKSMRMTGSE